MTKKRSENKKKMMIMAVLITVILGISSFSVIVFFPGQIKETEEKDSIKEIDDRISPLTTQGLFFETHQIRKKGIIGVMDLSYFQRPSAETEGVGFGISQPPYNRPKN